MSYFKEYAVELENDDGDYTTAFVDFYYYPSEGNGSYDDNAYIDIVRVFVGEVDYRQELTPSQWNHIEGVILSSMLNNE